MSILASRHRTPDNLENLDFSGLLRVFGSGRRKLTSDLDSTGQNTRIIRKKKHFLQDDVPKLRTTVPKLR